MSVSTSGPNGASSHPHPALARDSFKSPPPAADRMTPPPSTQAAPDIESRVAVRTPTPTRSHLSSPPPTLRRTRAFDEDTALASRDELIELAAQKDDDLRKANATIAAQRMQLLYAQEDFEHQAVEMRMQARDIDLLHGQIQVKKEAQQVQEHRSHLSAEIEQMHELRTRLDDALWENEQWRRQFARLEIEKQQVEDRFNTLQDQCYLLRGRLEEKAETVQILRSQLQAMSGVMRTAGSAQVICTPISRGPTARDAAIDQLLLADKMLQSQTSPSTPTPQRQQKRGYTAGHRRASHSLSSLQSAPMIPRSAQQGQRPSYAPLKLSSGAPYSAQTPASRSHQRPPSRDSTISASDADENSARRQRSPVARLHEPDVMESQASQAATDLLRRSTSNSFQDTAAHNASSLASGKPKKQTKLFGQITKPGVYHGASEAQSPSKKRRMDEGVGLGIGNWTSPRS